MSNFIQVREVRVISGSRAFELLSSKEPEDNKAGRKLVEFCSKASRCNYDLTALRELREQYSDVL